MRILRVYKLFRHFAGLQSLLYTLNQAYKELGLLLHIISWYENVSSVRYGEAFYFAVVGILCFASLVYICETELGSKEVPRIYLNRYTLNLCMKDQNSQQLFTTNLMSSTIFVKMNSTWTFPECFWWGLMTITTVGYDVNPDVTNKSELVLNEKYHI